MGRRPRIAGAILQLMGEEHRHGWTIEELHSALEAKGLQTDFSSVFRATVKLAGERAVARVDLDDGRSRFELSAGHHDHVRCERCGRIAALPCGVGEAIADQVEEATGFTVGGHRLVWTGTCSSCQSNSSPRRRPTARQRLGGAAVSWTGGPA